ncbi:MAG: hypothetical protein WC838_00805 [Candidatus Margulisiibacteriota bacterium]|jgi:hypothetical protein
MTSILDLVKQKPLTIIISLPKNDLDLAKAAFECGADAIKVHCNVEHRASGTRFGGWSEERAIIKKIIAAVKCPVGLMPGAGTTLTSAELLAAEQEGISFVDIYDHDMPDWMWRTKLEKMVAAGHDFSKESILAMAQKGADLIEASIIDPARYGEPLQEEDIANYQKIVQLSGRPIFVPTQKKIQPEELARLKKAGVKGVLLGAIVLGNSVNTFKERIPAFVKKTK